MERPLHPSRVVPGWSDLDLAERSRLNQEHRQAVLEWRLDESRLRRVPGFQEGARRFCMECGFGFERTDSYGDCADCGKPVIWVVVK